MPVPNESPVRPVADVIPPRPTTKLKQLGDLLESGERNSRMYDVRVGKGAFSAHWRTHLSLVKEAPIPRPVQPPELGRLVSCPKSGAASPIRTPRSLTERSRNVSCFHVA